MTEIGLIVGNGVAIDCAARVDLPMHPSRPLEWEFTVPGRDAPLPWREGLPRLAEAIGPLSPTSDHFRILAGISAAEEESDPTALLLDTEARHFLVLAYSHFSSSFASVLGTNINLPWKNWLAGHAGAVSFALSFNYDLILENLLGAHGVRTRAIGTIETGDGLPLLKPHGSVDFESLPHHLQRLRDGYPLHGYAAFCDTGMMRLAGDELATERTNPVAVLPQEGTPYLKYQFARPCYKLIVDEGQRLTHCIFLGVSYWEVDRPEIDRVLDSISSDCTVISANPEPHPDFVDRVLEAGLSHVCWPDGPKSLEAL